MRLLVRLDRTKLCLERWLLAKQKWFSWVVHNGPSLNLLPSFSCHGLRSVCCSHLRKLLAWSWRNIYPSFSVWQLVISPVTWTKNSHHHHPVMLMILFYVRWWSRHLAAGPLSTVLPICPSRVQICNQLAAGEGGNDADEKGEHEKKRQRPKQKWRSESGTWCFVESFLSRRRGCNDLAHCSALSQQGKDKHG